MEDDKMKITQSQLRQIIKEELDNVLQEDVIEKIQAIVKSGDVPKEKNAFMQTIANMGRKVQKLRGKEWMMAQTEFGKLLGLSSGEEAQWKGWRRGLKHRDRDLHKKTKNMDDLEVLYHMVQTGEGPVDLKSKRTARASAQQKELDTLQRDAAEEEERRYNSPSAIRQRAKDQEAGFRSHMDNRPENVKRKEMRAKGYFEDPENPGEYISSPTSSSRRRSRQSDIDDKNYRAAMREALREGNAEEFKTQLLKIIHSGK
tara:strand:+ start:194 stop:967 length:774 start_codon:yes stop_codon:yes gene_type:complete